MVTLRYTEFILLTAASLATLTAGANFDSSYKKWTHPRITSADVLKVDNGGPWGSSSHTAYCAPGTYAKGYSLKIEPPQGGSDDTSLNNIALLCAGRHSTAYSTVTVSPAPGFGKWTDPIICEGEDMFMTSFILNVEQPIEGDDTAANYVNFRCRKFDGSKQRIIKCNHVTTYGYYGQWSSSCPSDFAICGMETKSEPDQGRGDDTALNDVTFFCCDR